MPEPHYYQLAHFYPADRREWRRWLADNHAKSAGVWLVFYKKHTGKPTLTYEEAVEEAVASGWIDGRTRRLDEERYLLHFSPRRKGSIWARSNKQRVEELLRQGLMTSAGLHAVAAARQDGSWNLLDDVEDLNVPQDLAEALGRSEAANNNFSGYSDSLKRQVLWWLASAKRADTRQKRIDRVIAAAQRNASPFQEP